MAKYRTLFFGVEIKNNTSTIITTYESDAISATGSMARLSGNLTQIVVNVELIDPLDPDLGTVAVEDVVILEETEIYLPPSRCYISIKP